MSASPGAERSEENPLDEMLSSGVLLPSGRSPYAED